MFHSCIFSPLQLILITIILVNVYKKNLFQVKAVKAGPSAGGQLRSLRRYLGQIKMIYKEGGLVWIYVLFIRSFEWYYLESAMYSMGWEHFTNFITKCSQPLQIKGPCIHWIWENKKAYFWVRHLPYWSSLGHICNFSMDYISLF